VLLLLLREKTGTSIVGSLFRAADVMQRQAIYLSC